MMDSFVNLQKKAANKHIAADEARECVMKILTRVSHLFKAVIINICAKIRRWCKKICDNVKLVSQSDEPVELSPESVALLDLLELYFVTV